MRNGNPHLTVLLDPVPVVIQATKGAESRWGSNQKSFISRVMELEKTTYLNDDFARWFIQGSGDHYGVAKETTLFSSQLSLDVTSLSILAEIGEEAETTITEMSSLIRQQRSGDPGPLLTGFGEKNIFYIRDVDGTLREVGCSKAPSNWIICAIPLGGPYPLKKGWKVFHKK